MPDLTVTLVGGPTALLEYGGLRLLTDPTFDDAPRTYGRDGAPSLQKTAGPPSRPTRSGTSTSS